MLRVGNAVVISANCSNQPLPNGYTWTGGTCAVQTGATCGFRNYSAGIITFTVAASNAAGAGPAAPISITWQ